MKLDKKRRREKKTNYKKRLTLLKGETPRLVVRKTDRYLIIQIVSSRKAQDKIIGSVTTKDLLKFGWPENKKNSLKSITSGYLAGLLAGSKTKEKKVILDTGLIPNTKGSRVYSVVKGISDAGIDIPYNEKVVPDEKRLMGEHIKLEKETFNKIKEKILKVK